MALSARLQSRKYHYEYILVDLESLVIEESSLVVILKALVHKSQVIQSAGVHGVVLAKVALD